MKIIGIMGILFICSSFITLIPSIHSFITPLWFIAVGALALVFTAVAELESTQAIWLSFIWTIILFAFVRGKTFNTEAIDKWAPIICDSIAIFTLGFSLLLIFYKQKKKLENEIEILEPNRRLKLVLEKFIHGNKIWNMTDSEVNSLIEDLIKHKVFPQ
ncbi:hypothetical protein NYE80_30440 [Paenibacillus sp. FSL H7-0357]|uniref:hypothetical protein n=1 Tax=Paenibacillus sp. FSL H7-0357 TaxID=1536774 RepID=UPI0012E0481B|nr:hypothetical protein [Paenibacillus sp. FSL H7-0357]